MGYWGFAFGLLLIGLISVADGLSLQTEKGDQLGASSWVPYGEKLTKLPQCCAKDEDCQMVHISDELFSTLALSNTKERLRFTGKSGSLKAAMAFNETTGRVTGKVLVDGKLYFIQPIDDKEQRTCVPKNQAQHSYLYYKLIFMRENGDLPPALIIPLKGKPAPACCKDTLYEVCSTVSVDTSLLLTETKKVTIPLPWRAPQFYMDSQELFSLAHSWPKLCNGFCSSYTYSRFDGLSVEVTMDGSTPAVSLKAGGLDFSVNYCSAQPGHVLTAVEREISDEAYTLEGARVSELGCDYVGSICDFTGRTNVVGQEKLEEGSDYTTLCRQLCVADAACAHFSWFTARGETQCYLLNACQEDRHSYCINAATCSSGPKTCEANVTTVVTGCDPPTSLPTDYIPWQCKDIQGNILSPGDLDETIPVGVVCSLRCESWTTKWSTPAYLISECGEDGNWTATTSPQSTDGLQFPEGPYPLPTSTPSSDPAPLSCECAPLHLTVRSNASLPATYYNPSDEAGARFICDKNITEDGIKYIVNGDNACVLWCGKALIATLECVNGEWTGEPDNPFYCFESPAQGEWQPPKFRTNLQQEIIYIDGTSRVYQGPDDVLIDTLKDENTAHWNFAQDYVECQEFFWGGYEMLANGRTLGDYRAWKPSIDEPIYFHYIC